MLDTLCDVIDTMCSSEQGLHFTTADSLTSSCDYRQLREEVQHIARSLPALGKQRGAPVVIVFPEQAEFVKVFLAVIRAGLVVVPIYPPSLTGELTDYIANMERVIRITGACCLLTSDGLVSRFRSSVTAAAVVSMSEISARAETGELPTACRNDTALIQFTSGSTGSPKGVELTHGNLVANAMAIKHALAIDPARDQGVSWLPLHHDMGLIGFLITPLLVQASTWYLPPLEFARRPQRWLDLINKTRATISYAPNFGYDLVTRRVKDSEIEQWDLSAWRVAGCGGEPVLPDALDKFAKRLQPAKFDRRSFVPSYGMAEATVAVSISPLQRGVATCKPSGSAPDDQPMVSSGKPVSQTDIRIVSSSGNVIADGRSGEIQVRGPGVASRFLSEIGPAEATCSRGWLSTGDIGAMRNGELHVCGRIKETIVLHGRNVFAHDIEECAQELDGIKRGSVVAFGRPGSGSEQLVLVVETRRVKDANKLQHRLRSCVRKRLGLSIADILLVGRGVISRTTSGKLRRRTLRASYLAGELGVFPN